MIDTGFYVPDAKRSRLVDPPADKGVGRFEKGAPIAIVPVSRDAFFVDGGEHTRLAFLNDEVGKVTGLVLNPGPRQITGQRSN